jgi:acetyl-CoA acetyltransferase
MGARVGPSAGPMINSTIPINYDFAKMMGFAKRSTHPAGFARHLMIYDAFAHLPLYGLEDLGFWKPGEAAAFIRERNTAPGGKLPMNTMAAD